MQKDLKPSKIVPAKAGVAVTTTMHCVLASRHTEGDPEEHRTAQQAERQGAEPCAAAADLHKPINTVRDRLAKLLVVLSGHNTARMTGSHGPRGSASRFYNRGTAR